MNPVAPDPTGHGSRTLEKRVGLSRWSNYVGMKKWTGKRKGETNSKNCRKKKRRKK